MTFAIARWLVVGAFLAAWPAAWPLAAQEPDEDEEVEIDTISVLDSVYTEEQASRGNDVFQEQCASCHAPAEFSGRLFEIAWEDAAVYNLFRVASTTMPQDDPGGLEEEQYAAVIAYILELNDYPAGKRELTTDEDTLSAIIIEPPPDDDDPQR